MEVKKIVEGMTAPQVAQVIDENFNSLNNEKATTEAVEAVQKNVTMADDNTGVASYPEYSSTEPVAVGDVRRYEGLLYRSKEAGAYDWDPEKWERVTLKQLEDEKLSELGSKVEIPISEPTSNAVDITNNHIVGEAGQTIAITQSNGTQTSVVFKVSKGETYSAKVYQYSDTSALAFSEELPQVGSSAYIFAVGDHDNQDSYEKEVRGTAPSDGYFVITYLNTKQSVLNVYKLIPVNLYINENFGNINNNIEVTSTRIVVDGSVSKKFVFTKYPLMKGHTYRLYISNSWNFPDVPDILFEVYTVKKHGGNVEYDIFYTQNNTSTAIPKYIDISVPTDAEGDFTLGIYMYIEETDSVFFDIVDTTPYSNSIDLLNNSVEHITEYTPIPFKYISNQGAIVEQTSTTLDKYNIVELIQVNKGDVIYAEMDCWSDTCAIAFKKSKDDTIFKVLQLGKKESNDDTTAVYSLVLEESGYVSFSYSEKSGFVLDIKSLSFASKEDVEHLRNKANLALSKATRTEIELDFKTVEYRGSDFAKTMGKYIYYDGTLRSVASCFISKPLFYEIGDTITVGVNCYGDMATIAKTDNEGAIEKVVMLGGGENHQVSNHDFYVYTMVVIEEGYYVVSGEWTDETFLSYKRKESQRLKELGNGVNVDLSFLPMCQFVGLEAEAANGMENWTGQQVIDNIYEPLRQQYPQYIKRKSIGKSGGFDLWVYEFNNSVEEWFALDNYKKLSDGVFLPSTNGLTSKQMAIRKDVFDSTFNMEYKNLYPLSNFSVRKPSLAELKETMIDGVKYVLFTCMDVIKVTENSVDVYWTSEVKTFDQHCFIVSGTHADENGGYLGTALALKYLVEHHSESAIMSYIFNNVKLSVVPILNMWGANQTPKSRTAQDGSSMNSWAKDNLNEEQRALFNYIEPIKDELSFFVDNHTAEWWNNYGYVYAIAQPHQKLMPSITSAANYLCKHWFPNEPALNWNIGQLPNVSVSSTFIKEELGIETATVEFCGQDLMAFAPCSRWDGKYMTFATENYLNFLLSLVAARLKSNGKNITNDKFFEHRTMS